jgi:hypothetical protein
MRTLAQDFSADKPENPTPSNLYVQGEAGRSYFAPLPDFSSIESYLSGLDKGAPATPHSTVEAKPVAPIRRRTWKQRDITRALRAAEKAGVTTRVEITPDGKLSLVPESRLPNGGVERITPNPWDSLFNG